MTSPDQAGIPELTQGQPLGDWDMDVDIAGLLSAFTGKWSKVDQTALDLYDTMTRTQKLEGVIGYGSARMSGSFTPGNNDNDTGVATTRVPFRTGFGPKVGLTHAIASGNGFFVLGSAGLWEFSTKVTWDFLIGGDHGVFLTTTVLAPNGTVFYQSPMVTETTDTESTIGETGRFVVPAAGYRVEVRASARTSYRGIRGDVGYSQLNLLKVSSETA